MALKSVKELECGICCETYFEPRILPCGHTFCLTCLQRQATNVYSPQNCAACRRSFTIPGGSVAALPKNFSLIEVISLMNQREPTNAVSCSAHPRQNATGYCRSCKCFICEPCAERLHADHTQCDLNAVAKEFCEALSTMKNMAVRLSGNCQKDLARVQAAVATITSEIEKKQREGILLAKRCEDALGWPLAEQAKFVNSPVLTNDASVVVTAQWIQGGKISARLKCAVGSLTQCSIGILSASHGVVLAGCDTSKDLQVFDRSKGAQSDMRRYVSPGKFSDAVIISDSRAMCASRTECFLLPDNTKSVASPKSAYLLSGNKNDTILVTDFKLGVFEFDTVQNAWTNVLKISGDKQCWHAINIDRLSDEVRPVRTYWVIEYTHSLRRFSLQEYVVGESKVTTTAISTHLPSAGAGNEIQLAEYGMISYGCSRMTYDGHDTVYLRDYSKAANIFVFSVAQKSVLCRLRLDDQIPGVAKGLACDVHTGLLYIGLQEGLVIECKLAQRKRQHDLKVTII